MASVVFSVVFGFVTDFRAERSLEALRNLTAPTVPVVRGGSPAGLSACTSCSRPTARSRLENLHKDYRGIQLKWHTFRTREVAKDCSDLLKLGHALDAEAQLMLRCEKT